MRAHRCLSSRASAAALLALGLALGLAAAQDDAPPMPAEEQPEVLTSGPVNEAFAEPVNLEAQTGQIAPIEPPPAIEEAPPPDKPAGANFAWVPGYWAWDLNRRDHVWVSACWRAAPPNMAWMPGYWTPADGGWEWVPGFWAPAGSTELVYLPTPPAPLDMDPPCAPPHADQTWVPGCWYWQGGRYVHRRGYWLTQQHGWMWTPSHHVRTPRGYVFAPGHWDLSLERRGVLFAPAAITHTQYSRPGFRYTPRLVIDLKAMSANLFVCPRYSHYFVGDFYDRSCLNVGIIPRCQTESLRKCYDPIYVHAQWYHHGDANNWHTQQRQDYEYRRDHEQARPARTWREQEVRVQRLPAAQRPVVQVAVPINVFATGGSTRVTFERANHATQQAIVHQAQAVQHFRDDRVRWESGVPLPATVRPVEPVRPTDPGHGPGRPVDVVRPVQPVTPGNPRPGEPNHNWGQPRPAMPTEPVHVHISAAPVVGQPVGPAAPPPADASANRPAPKASDKPVADTKPDNSQPGKDRQPARGSRMRLRDRDQ